MACNRTLDTREQPLVAASLVPADANVIPGEPSCVWSSTVTPEDLPNAQGVEPVYTEGTMRRVYIRWP